MTCKLCGDICRCSSGASSGASPRWLADDGAGVVAASPQAMPETTGEKAPGVGPDAEASLPKNDDHADSAPEDSTAWRQEVAARLDRYHARRKPRPPRYPSLRLRFEGEAPTGASAVSLESALSPPPTATASHQTLTHQTLPHQTLTHPTLTHQALALDGFAGLAVHAVEPSASRPLAPPDIQTPHEITPFLRVDEAPQHSVPAMASTAAQSTAPFTAKIIEFPRSWTPPPAPLDELAEPVMHRPRILEAPEVVPQAPALGGITIEPAPQPEMEKRLGIDIPLRSAPLARRVFCAALDGTIIAAACALFGFIFWKMTAIRPPRLQLVGLAAGLSGLFWAAYHYLLLVYAGTTPGLRVAGLELARFDGSAAGRRLRRWRVLASFLSAASLGMGYAWVFLDEDALCWHDRITHTYLAPKTHIADQASAPTQR